MKVILVEDVKSLGKKGDIVNVSDGYARNMLFPKKLGLEATSKNINDLKLQRAHEDKVAKEQFDAAQAFKAELETQEVTVSVKTVVPSVPFLQKSWQRQRRNSWDMTLTRRKCSFPPLSKNWEPQKCPFDCIRK